MARNRLSPYGQAIAPILAKHPQREPWMTPHQIEAWMRLEYGTLDHLSREKFNREARIGIECAAAAGEEQTRELAASYGLDDSPVRAAGGGS